MNPQLMSKLIPELQRVQHELGYVPREELSKLAETLELPLYHIYGVVTFYPHFRLTPPPRTTIHVCQDLLCHLKHGGRAITEAQQLASTLGGQVEVRGCSCLGQCDSAPAAMIDHHPYATGSTDKLMDAIRLAIAGGQVEFPPSPAPPPPFRCDPYGSDAQAKYGALRGVIQRIESIDEPDEGRALEKHLEIAMQITQQMIDAGLRGMGGGGFPVGRKWQGVLRPALMKRPERYIICNADESEVGTFKDREILRHLPHLILEGMAIAGALTRATKGYLYIRHEYVDQIEACRAALDEARACGALGRNVFGSGLSFDIELFISAGGYIQGEASALMEAIEGKRGQPRLGGEDGAPRSTTSGLFGMPTIVNNVESFVHVPAILVKGVEWFREQGLGGNHGLKFVGIGGDVVNPQVLEVPHGMTFRDALDKVGGMAGGKQLKAIMPSGPSFGFLPAQYLDARMEFPNPKSPGELMKADASIGSAAVVFLNEDRDLIDCAINCTRFYRNESCGKCVPCRVGSQKMVDICEGVLAGTARADDIDQVERLMRTLYLTSICGLGQVVPKPFETVVKYWGETDPRIRAARRRGTTTAGLTQVTVNGKGAVA